MNIKGAVPKGYNWMMANLAYEGDECLLWPFSTITSGYGAFMLEKVSYLAHRFACQAEHGDPPTPLHQAAHSCGRSRCINRRHLSWKTNSANQLDRNLHGTMNVKHSKITAEQAEQIRQLKGVERRVIIAERFGMSESNVNLIWMGKSWGKDRKIPMPLTDDQVRTVRRIGYSKTGREIAGILGVSIGAVQRARFGSTHKTVV